MRTVFFDERGNLCIREEKAAGPGDNEVLVRMKACGICLYDTKCFKDPALNPAYSARPGHEGVGVVLETGKNVRDLAPGDKVTSVSFGGGLSEVFLAERGTVARIPDEVENYEQWISEPVACVVNALRYLRIEPGDDVVVLGCGYMGLLIIQGLPKEYIHTLVAVDLLDDRLALAKKYGADHVIDAKKTDPVEAVLDITKRKVDVVIEAVGNPPTIGQATNMLRNGARLCIFGHHAVDETVPTCDWHMKGLEILNTTPFSSKNFSKDLEDAVRLMERGRFSQVDLISRTYRPEELERALHELTPKPPDVIKAVIVNY